MRNIMTESGHRTVVIGPAPFPEHIGQPVDIRLNAVIRPVLPDKVFSGLFAYPVGIVQ